MADSEEGQSHPATLFEVVVELDAGPVYLQWQIHAQTPELLKKWPALHAQLTLELCSGGLD